VFSYYRLCSLTTDCVLLLQIVFSYYRMCSLTTVLERDFSKLDNDNNGVIDYAELTNGVQVLLG